MRGEHVVRRKVVSTHGGETCGLSAGNFLEKLALSSGLVQKSVSLLHQRHDLVKCALTIIFLLVKSFLWRLVAMLVQSKLVF